MTQISSIHPIVLWSKNRLDEMEAALLEVEKDSSKAKEDIKAGVVATLAKAKQSLDDFKVRMQSNMQEVEKKGGAASKSAKQEMQQDWKKFEEAMNAAVARLNNGQIEFEARAAAQLKSWQETMQRFNTAAAGIAADQKESFNAALKQMQDKAQAGKQRFAEVRQAASNSPEPYRVALKKCREAFEEAYESVKSKLAKV
jgi:hypothetical protein